jgi:hypothetical protein
VRLILYVVVLCACKPVSAVTLDEWLNQNVASNWIGEALLS